MARASRAEIERAADFRSALRWFLARTEDAVAEAGLTPQRYHLLLMIKAGHDETSTVGELCGRLALRQTAVTELVRRAEEAGLVARSVSPDDARVFLLRLTPEGDDRLLEAFVALRAERRTLADTLDELAAQFRNGSR